MPLIGDPGVMAHLEPLSPTPRTRPVRSRDRTQSDRAALRDTLDGGLVCHLGVVVDDAPRVLPTAYGVDWAGDDPYGTLYLHGSVAAHSLRAAPTQTVCVTVTIVDGLVLARSAFHHSANYRSAVVLGQPRLVTDDAERRRALDLIIEHLVPGRAPTMRPHTRKELAATAVLALSLREASVKVRSGDPVDEPFDVEAGGVWAGVLPIRVVTDPPVTAQDSPPGVPVPDHVTARALDEAALDRSA